MDVSMQMSQSGEMVSKSNFVSAQKGQRGPEDVFCFPEGEFGRCQFARAASKDVKRTREHGFQPHGTQSAVDSELHFSHSVFAWPRTKMRQLKKVTSHYAFFSSSYGKRQRPTKTKIHNREKAEKKIQSDKQMNQIDMFRDV